MFEDRCLHEMLILNGKMTCSLCLGLDDTMAMQVAGMHESDLVTMQNLNTRLSVGLRIQQAA